jgi:anaerobic selenocysteine-containing dehydrogenase
MVETSPLLCPHLVKPAVYLHPRTAAGLGLEQGQPVTITLSGMDYSSSVLLDENAPEGVALVPRSAGLPVNAPLVITLVKNNA